MNDAGEWLPLPVISVEGGPDTGHPRGQLSRQVKEVSLGVMSQDRGAVCEKRNPVMGQGRLRTLVSREAGNHSWPRSMCTRVCEAVSRDEDGGDKACGSYRARWEGIPHLAYLSLLAGAGSWDGTSLLDNPRVLVQRLSKCVWSHLTNPANFLQIWLPYSGGKYSLSLLGAMWVSVTFVERRYKKGRREACFINICSHNSEILWVWFQTTPVKWILQ